MLITHAMNDSSTQKPQSTNSSIKMKGEKTTRDILDQTGRQQSLDHKISETFGTITDIPQHSQAKPHTGQAGQPRGDH